MNEAIDKVIDALGPLAEKLGEGAEHAYGVYVYEATARGIRTTVAAVLLVALAVVLGLVARKLFSTQNHDAEFFAGVAVLSSGVTTIAAGFVAYRAAALLMNPEFYAIRELMWNVTGR